MILFDIQKMFEFGFGNVYHLTMFLWGFLKYVFWSFITLLVAILLLFIALGLVFKYQMERISKKKNDAVKKIAKMVLDCLREINNGNGASGEEIDQYINERENFKLGWIRPQVRKFLKKAVLDGRLEKINDSGAVKFRIRISKDEEAQKKIRKLQERENKLTKLQKEFNEKRLEKMNEHN